MERALNLNLKNADQESWSFFEIQYRTEYSYNSNGDLVSKTELKDHGNHYGHFKHHWFQKHDLRNKKKLQTQYFYDSFGNLNKVILPNNDVVEYVIDGQNRRVGKKLNGKLLQMLVYQSQTQIAAELDGQGNLVRRYVYGSKINVPDYFVQNGVKYKIISDHLGSPRLIVNASSGKIIDEMSFDEFGILEKDYDREDRDNIEIPFGFAGGLYDEHTGLVRFGARDYDPTVGRWTTKDPIGFGGGDTNLYNYVANNPLSYIDPEGTFALPLFLGIFAGVFYATDLDTPDAAQDELLGVPLSIVGGATSGSGKVICEAGGDSAKYAATKTFGKGGLLNSNRYLRIGISRKGGDKVFRITGDWVGGRHIDLWNFGPL